MTQTEEHLTGDGIQVQDDISITIRPAAAWMRNLAAVFLAACGFIGTIAAVDVFADLQPNETDSHSRCDFHLI